MKNKWTRSLALLLTVVMAFSLLQFPAFAEDARAEDDTSTAAAAEDSGAVPLDEEAIAADAAMLGESAEAEQASDVGNDETTHTTEESSQQDAEMISTETSDGISVYSEDYRAWSQRDSRWANLTMSSDPGATVRDYGCAAASVTKLIIQAGLRSQDSFNIGTFVTQMNSVDGFEYGGAIRWAYADKVVSGFSYAGSRLNGTYSTSAKNDELMQLIKSGYHLIIKVPSGNNPSHYIAVDEAQSLAHGQIYYMDSDPLRGKSAADVALTSTYSTFYGVILYTGGTSAGGGSSGGSTSNRYNPIGSVDGAQGGERSIHVSGWAYDPDDPSQSIEVHVYVGGIPGSGAPGYAIKADKRRDDVYSANGAGLYSGFDETISVSVTGTKKLYFYGINIGGGTNPEIGTATVTITEDNTAPVISDIKVTDLSSTGYTVTCKVTDAGGIDRVQFPTWTLYGGQDDLVGDWITNSKCSGTINGDQVSFRVNISDHNYESGDYVTDIYAYDKAGNCANDRTGATVPKPLELWDVTVSDVSESGYTVSGTLSNPGSVDRVQFPTWSVKDGKDDLADGWETDPAYSGTISGDKVTFRVNTADHKNDTGLYSTHIYVYDKSGNYVTYKARADVAPSGLTEAASCRYGKNRYVLFTGLVGDERFDFTEAKTYCESVGGHLVTITSAEEQAAVDNMISASDSISWIGATDECSEGSWKWVTGEEFNYSNWLDGQPDNYQDGQDYALMFSDGKCGWDDVGKDNGSVEYFVCEFENYCDHTYGAPTFNWGDDHSTCTAVFTCTSCQKQQSVDCTVTSETTAATCTEAGETRYTASTDFSGGYTDTQSVEIPALGHTYDAPTFNWNSDYSACTAVFTCTNCQKQQSVDCTVTSEITPATKTEDGKTVYTASVELNGQTYTEQKTAVIPALGDETLIASGTCGDNLTWTLDSAGTLTASGTGKMTNWSSWEDTPWWTVHEQIKKVIVEDGVTSIGPQSFNWCSNLESATVGNDVKYISAGAFAHTDLKEITLGSSVEYFGDNVFMEDKALTSITIPAKVNQIGLGVFENCTGLTEVRFTGDAPNFVKAQTGYSTYNDNFNGVTATVYYPAGNETWASAANKNYGGTLTWVAYTVDPEPIENPFVDVSESDYYYDAVLWAYSNNITSGKDATHFQPDAACTRAQVVTFLWRANGQPEPTSTTNPFVDVSKDSYYYKAVLWAAEKGITSGKDATHFQPDATVTRAQFVTFLWRSEGKPAPKGDNPFVDVANGQYYTDAVVWAYENGITSGKDATHFQPDANCIRAQVVTFLYRDMK